MYETEPLTKLIEQVVSNPVGEDAARISALYNNILDWDARNAAGIEPIRSYLEAAEAAQSVDEVMAVKEQIASDLGGNLLIGFSLSTDAKDSTRYTVEFSPLSPSLTKEIYAADSGSQKDAYLTYMQTLFQLGGADAQSAQEDALRIWEMEKELSVHAVSYTHLDVYKRQYPAPRGFRASGRSGNHRCRTAGMRPLQAAPCRLRLQCVRSGCSDRCRSSY